MNDSPIFIVGFTAVGKSTYGKSLAKKLNLPFIDLDKLIEQERLYNSDYHNISKEAFNVGLLSSGQVYCIEAILNPNTKSDALYSHLFPH
jgi:adenylate kinase family enzyme